MAKFYYFSRVIALLFLTSYHIIEVLWEEIIVILKNNNNNNNNVLFFDVRGLFALFSEHQKQSDRVGSGMNRFSSFSDP